MTTPTERNGNTLEDHYFVMRLRYSFSRRKTS